MLNPLRLLLPALIPSWNFFDVIARSPRVEYALDGGAWREFRPRPQRVSAAQMAMRLVWNARWNEALFVTACAERLLQHTNPHAETEIFRRIAADLDAPPAAILAFRIQLIDAEGRETAYRATPRRIAQIAPP